MNSRSEELYERLYEFAKNFQVLTRMLPKNLHNSEYISQGIRSSSSVGANYIEAIDGLSRKDFIHRLKICRKEARESIHWLRLIKDSNDNYEVQTLTSNLIQEASAIKKIFTSAVMTSETRFKSENK